MTGEKPGCGDDARPLRCHSEAALLLARDVIISPGFNRGLPGQLSSLLLAPGFNRVNKEGYDGFCNRFNGFPSVTNLTRNLPRSIPVHAPASTLCTRQ